MIHEHHLSDGTKIRDRYRGKTIRWNDELGEWEQVAMYDRTVHPPAASEHISVELNLGELKGKGDERE